MLLWKCGISKGGDISAALPPSKNDCEGMDDKEGATPIDEKAVVIATAPKTTYPLPVNETTRQSM